MTEKITVVKRSDLDKVRSLKVTEIIHGVIEHSFGMPKDDVEENEEYVQLIPYVAITDELGRIFIYRRVSGDKRLEGKLSIGLGEHLRFGEDVMHCIYRELSEEIGIEPKRLYAIKYYGLYHNMRGDAVDRVHAALMFHGKIHGTLPPISNREIEGRFTDVITAEDYEHLELWSKALLEMMTRAGDTE